LKFWKNHKNPRPDVSFLTGEEEGGIRRAVAIWTKPSSLPNVGKYERVKKDKACSMRSSTILWGLVKYQRYLQATLIGVSICLYSDLQGSFELRMSRFVHEHYGCFLGEVSRFRGFHVLGMTLSVFGSKKGRY